MVRSEAVHYFENQQGNRTTLVEHPWPAGVKATLVCPGHVRLTRLLCQTHFTDLIDGKLIAEECRGSPLELIDIAGPDDPPQLPAEWAEL